MSKTECFCCHFHSLMVYFCSNFRFPIFACLKKVSADVHYLNITHRGSKLYPNVQSSELYYNSQAWLKCWLSLYLWKWLWKDCHGHNKQERYSMVLIYLAICRTMTQSQTGKRFKNKSKIANTRLIQDFEYIYRCLFEFILCF